MRSPPVFAISLVLATGSVGGSDHPAEAVPVNVVATFSIVAADPATGEVGVAVASKFIAVGNVVPWAKAGVGAVATQALANVGFGPEGLALLEKGTAPMLTVEKLIAGDPGSARRQLGLINAQGEAATFTGEGCHDAAFGITGRNYSVQGNLLASKKVIEAMATAFEKSEAPLPQRMLDALKAGQDEGGDKRGRQSAALLVVRRNWGFAGMNDRFRDLRVDEHVTPIAELQRIYDLHSKVFPRPTPNIDAED